MLSSRLLKSSILKSVAGTLKDTGLPAFVTQVLCFNSSHSGDRPSSNNSSLTTYKKRSSVAFKDKSFEHYTPSPYKTPGPRRYGYVQQYKTDGLLPRDGKPVRSLPPYRPKDKWTKKKALFGQNDYIDILGDGEIHPADLLTGPRWLIAFKGNERERLMRKMEWEGNRLRVFYPSEYNRIEKRIRYLTKLYNLKRSRRWAD